jgi:predicted transcriptional regulator
LPESLWHTKRNFFQSFGLVRAHSSANQYRYSNRELVIRAMFQDVWRAVLSKIAKVCRRFSLIENPLSGGVLFSVLPEYAEKIVRGIKTVEVRRRFSERWVGQRAVLYATKISAILGEARISCVRSGPPERIWSEFGSAIQCTQGYYDSYVDGCKTVYAICLEDITRYVAPVQAATLAHYIGSSVLPPRSYIHLRHENKWSEAVNISELLQCLYQSVSIPDSTRLVGKSLAVRT